MCYLNDFFFCFQLTEDFQQPCSSTLGEKLETCIIIQTVDLASCFLLSIFLMLLKIKWFTLVRLSYLYVNLTYEFNIKY